MAHDTDSRPEAAAAASLCGLPALRRHTAALHQQLEALPLARAMLAPALDLPRYRRALAAWADAWWPLEQAIAGSPHAEPLADLLPPARHALALADLHWLDRAAPPVPAAAAPWRSDGDGNGGAQAAALRALQAATDTPAALLGLCYVLRGASLGSQVIAAHLRTTLALDGGNGASFFATRHAHALGWPAWMAAADRRLGGATATAQACQGAAAGFGQMMAAFQRWQPGPDAG